MKLKVRGNKIPICKVEINPCNGVNKVELLRVKYGSI